MERNATVTVRQGYAIPKEKEQIRTFCIRELTGNDEEHLSSLGKDVALPMKTMELLTRILSITASAAKRLSLCNPTPDVRQIIGELTLGDRTILLLCLRRLMLGDKMQCDVVCLTCKEPMSLEIRVSDLIGDTEESVNAKHKAKICGFNLRIRPVNGNDQELILSLTNNTIVQYTDHLIRRCILSSEPTLPKELPEEFVTKVSSLMEEIDPIGHIELNLTCPSCKNCFQCPFYAEDFIFRELFIRQQELEHEVHLLAFYYHWSEKEILSLPTRKRKRYVEQICTTISGEINL